MDDYAVYQTDWDELSSMTRKNLTVTGYAAIDHVTGEKDLADQEGIVCYSTIPSGDFENLKDHLTSYELSIPEPGSQELYVIHGDYPSAHFIDGVPIAEPDTLLKDAITSDPRKFRKEVKHNEDFRTFMQQSLSRNGKQNLLEKYDEDDYVFKEISDMLEKL